MKKALLYLFAFICIQYFVSWAVFAVWLLAAGHSSSDVLAVLNGQKLELITPPMQILSCAVYSALTLALFVWRKWAVLSPAYLRSGKWGIFFWSGIASLGTLLPSVWLQSLMPDLANTSEETFRQLMSSQYGYFVLCLLVPFVEETVFRGASSSRFSQLLASVGGHIDISAVFAVIHLNPAQMPHPSSLVCCSVGCITARGASCRCGRPLGKQHRGVCFVHTVPAYSRDEQSRRTFRRQSEECGAVADILYVHIPARHLSAQYADEKVKKTDNFRTFNALRMAMPAAKRKSA